VIGEDGRMDSDLHVARRAALAGAEVALGYFAALADLPRERKADGSVVTEADRAAETAIRDVVAGARPDDAFLGEENGQTSGPTGPADRRWIVDPIDGTALFVAGDDRWLVLVALESGGEIVAGVAAVPAQGRIWWAALGAGAWEADLDGGHERRISVNDGDRATDTPRGGDVLRGRRFGVVPGATEVLTPAELDMIAPLRAVTPEVPWRVHPALLVARGDMDLAVQTRGKLWDFAALSLILTEAGGRYSGVDGRPGPADGPSLYARDDVIQAAALALLHAG
jgi:histidinol-phosphatase